MASQAETNWKKGDRVQSRWDPSFRGTVEAVLDVGDGKEVLVRTDRGSEFWSGSEDLQPESE